MKKSVLILKTGHNETFANDSKKVGVISLGDVLRTTPLLPTLKNFNITWVSTTKALPLLSYNDYINELLGQEEYLNKIESFERFDLCLNLEKSFQKSHLAKHKKLIGYKPREDEYCSDILITDEGKEITLKNFNKESQSLELLTWQEKFAFLMGHKYNKEKYQLNYRPERTLPKVDVALNWRVGSKWPTKEIPLEKWEELALKLEKNKISYDWQPRPTNLEDYMQWIFKSKVVVTNDSLGLHLAMAFNKKVIAFFGPTDPKELELYHKVNIVKFDTPSHYDCLPCLEPTCFQEKVCTSFMNPDKVLKKIVELL